MRLLRKALLSRVLLSRFSHKQRPKRNLKRVIEFAYIIHLQPFPAFSCSEVLVLLCSKFGYLVLIPFWPF